MGDTGPMASYTVNERAVTHAKKLIEAHQYVLESNWGEVAPTPTRRTRSSTSTHGTSTPSGTSG
jgi:hypothetical protein